MIDVVGSISVDSITQVDSTGFCFLEKSSLTQQRECKLRSWDDETQHCTTQFVLQETSTADSTPGVYAQSTLYFLRYSPDTGDHAVMQTSSKSVVGRAAKKKHKSKAKFIVASESEPAFFLCVSEDAVCYGLVVKPKASNPIRISSEIKLRGVSKVVSVTSSSSTAVTDLIFAITYANGDIELWRSEKLYQVMKKKAYGVKKKNKAVSADGSAEDDDDEDEAVPSFKAGTTPIESLTFYGTLQQPPLDSAAAASSTTKKSQSEVKATIAFHPCGSIIAAQYGGQTLGIYTLPPEAILQTNTTVAAAAGVVLPLTRVLKVDDSIAPTATNANRRYSLQHLAFHLVLPLLLVTVSVTNIEKGSLEVPVAPLLVAVDLTPTYNTSAATVVGKMALSVIGKFQFIEMATQAMGNSTRISSYASSSLSICNTTQTVLASFPCLEDTGGNNSERNYQVRQYILRSRLSLAWLRDKGLLNMLRPLTATLDNTITPSALLYGYGTLLANSKDMSKAGENMFAAVNYDKSANKGALPPTLYFATHCSEDHTIRIGYLHLLSSTHSPAGSSGGSDDKQSDFKAVALATIPCLAHVQPDSQRVHVPTDLILTDNSLSALVEGRVVGSFHAKNVINITARVVCVQGIYTLTQSLSQALPTDINATSTVGNVVECVFIVCVGNIVVRLNLKCAATIQDEPGAIIGLSQDGLIVSVLRCTLDAEQDKLNIEQVHNLVLDMSYDHLWSATGSLSSLVLLLTEDRTGRKLAVWDEKQGSSVCILKADEHVLQVAWQPNSAKSQGLPEALSTAIQHSFSFNNSQSGLLGMLTNQRVMMLDDKLKIVAKHKQGNVNNILWVGLSLLFTCRDGAVKYLTLPPLTPSLTKSSSSNVSVQRLLSRALHSPGQDSSSNQVKILCHLPSNLCSHGYDGMMIAGLLTDRMILLYSSHDAWHCTMRPVNLLEPILTGLLSNYSTLLTTDNSSRKEELLQCIYYVLAVYRPLPQHGAVAIDQSGNIHDHTISRSLLLQALTLSQHEKSNDRLKQLVLLLSEDIDSTGRRGRNFRSGRHIPTGITSFLALQAEQYMQGAAILLTDDSPGLLEVLQPGGESYGGSAMLMPQSHIAQSLAAFSALITYQSQLKSEQAALTKALAMRLADLSGDGQLLTQQATLYAPEDLNTLLEEILSQLLTYDGYMERKILHSLLLSSYSPLNNKNKSQKKRQFAKRKFLLILSNLSNSIRRKSLLSFTITHSTIKETAGDSDSSASNVFFKQQAVLRDVIGQRYHGNLGPSHHITTDNSTHSHNKILSLDLVEEYLGSNAVLESVEPRTAASSGNTGGSNTAGGATSGASTAQALANRFFGHTILPVTWVDSVGEGTRELDKVSAYYRLSDAAALHEAGYVNTGRPPTSLTFLDLSRFEGSPLELYTNQTGAKLFRIEATGSNIAAGERHESCKLLADIVHMSSQSPSMKGGLRMYITRGSPMDIGLCHSSETRTRMTLEFFLCLQSPPSSYSSVTLAKRMTTHGSILWRLYVDDHGDICLSVLQGKKMKTNATIDLLLAASTAAATATTAAAEEEESGDESDTATDTTARTKQHWHHIAFILDSSDSNCTSTPTDNNDYSIAHSQPIKAWFYLDGQNMFPSSSSPALISCPEATVMESDLSSSTLMILPDVAGAYRITEIRVWAMLRSQQQLVDNREAYLGLAEKRIRLQLQLKGAKKLFARAFKEIEVIEGYDDYDIPQILPTTAQQAEEEAAQAVAVAGGKSGLLKPTAGGVIGMAPPPASGGPALKRPSLAPAAAAVIAPVAMTETQATTSTSTVVAEPNTATGGGKVLTARERRLSQIKTQPSAGGPIGLGLGTAAVSSLSVPVTSEAVKPVMVIPEAKAAEELPSLATLPPKPVKLLSGSSLTYAIIAKPDLPQAPPPLAPVANPFTNKPITAETVAVRSSSKSVFAARVSVPYEATLSMPGAASTKAIGINSWLVTLNSSEARHLMLFYISSGATFTINLPEGDAVAGTPLSASVCVRPVGTAGHPVSLAIAVQYPRLLAVYNVTVSLIDHSVVDVSKVVALPLSPSSLRHYSFLTPDLLALVTLKEGFSWRAAVNTATNQHYDPMKILTRIADKLQAEEKVLELAVAPERWTLLVLASAEQTQRRVTVHQAKTGRVMMFNTAVAACFRPPGLLLLLWVTETAVVVTAHELTALGDFVIPEGVKEGVFELEDAPCVLWRLETSLAAVASSSHSNWQLFALGDKVFILQHNQARLYLLSASSKKSYGSVQLFEDESCEVVGQGVVDASDSSNPVLLLQVRKTDSAGELVKVELKEAASRMKQTNVVK